MHTDPARQHRMCLQPSKSALRTLLELLVAAQNETGGLETDAELSPQCSDDLLGLWHKHVEGQSMVWTDVGSCHFSACGDQCGDAATAGPALRGRVAAVPAVGLKGSLEHA